MTLVKYVMLELVMLKYRLENFYFKVTGLRNRFLEVSGWFIHIWGVDLKVPGEIV